MHTPRSLFAITSALVISANTVFAQGAAPVPGAAHAPADAAKSAAEMVIQALEHDTAIHAYQWTETMVVMVDGKEKETVSNACSYNTEGRVVRSPTAAAAVQPAKTGVPGTKAEIDSYLKSAVALMREYVRPDPQKLEECENAARVTVANEAGGRMKIDFKDYLKRGDDLSLVVDSGTNQVVSSSASSYLTNMVDRAEIHTEMSQLPDGAGYPSHIKFDTPGRQLGVTVTNSDYRKKTSDGYAARRVVRTPPRHARATPSADVRRRGRPRDSLRWPRRSSRANRRALVRDPKISVHAPSLKTIW
jgi:hypothetical protein